MHGSIRDGLEDLLAGKRPAIESRGGVEAERLSGHLHSCEECSSEFETMQAHSTLLRGLRQEEEVDAAPGFYARVMQRIEERAKQSIWAVWVYSSVGKRLTFASFALAVVLGSYFIAQESRDGHLMAGSMVAQGLHFDAPVIGSPSEQRDAVLENFALQRVALQRSPR
jgi:predicted anti-sigma-YlaC factor YlaD